MKVKTINYPASLKKGDLILVNNGGEIFLHLVKDFKCINDYCYVVLGHRVDEGISIEIKLKDLQNNNDYLLILKNETT